MRAYRSQGLTDAADSATHEKSFIYCETAAPLTFVCEAHTELCETGWKREATHAYGLVGFALGTYFPCVRVFWGTAHQRRAAQGYMCICGPNARALARAVAEWSTAESVAEEASASASACACACACAWAWAWACGGAARRGHLLLPAQVGVAWALPREPSVRPSKPRGERGGSIPHVGRFWPHLGPMHVHGT